LHELLRSGSSERPEGGKNTEQPAQVDAAHQCRYRGVRSISGRTAYQESYPAGKKDMAADNLKIDASKLLEGMYRDGYFPNFLVDKVRDVILDACREIEAENPKTYEDLYAITCRATEKINDLQEDFEENDSEIETVARDDIAVTFGYVAKTYGFPDADLEELVATRDW
jgi:hypothetical protein